MLVKELSFIESTSLVGALQNHQDWVWLIKLTLILVMNTCVFGHIKLTYLTQIRWLRRSGRCSMVWFLWLKMNICHHFKEGVLGYGTMMQVFNYRSSAAIDLPLRWYDVFWAWDHELKKTLVSTGASNHDALVRLEQAEQLFASQCKVDPVWPELHFTEGLGKSIISLPPFQHKK